MVLYVYRHDRAIWHYCEEKINDSERAAVQKWLQVGYEQNLSRCAPVLPVEADLSTADYNPFIKPKP